MKDEQVWYIDQRAEALAFVYLTRRSDLLVHRQSGDYGYDFLVEIVRDQQATRRVFGVHVNARIEPIQNPQLFEMKHGVRKELPFPLCLFFFTMQTDQAFYTWITEPFITNDGHPKLRFTKDDHLLELDNAALSRIVDQVDRWYDALFKELAA